MTAALKPGDRAEVTPEAVRIVRPKGTPVGEIVADRGDSYAIRFDGTKSPRVIWKPYIKPLEARA